ncbi:MAG TPA: homogentisate 1,2-dioxygenase [Solirubrobacterales bacterium]|jgi:homogentisate 1,2-dioxygenase|nr:homogentisate 1,2-dioxygenase [Solirubrobacterales bacterium]
MRYHRLGDIPRKRHVQVRDNGRLLVEEVMGFEGFSGNESILYHLQSPCRISEAGEHEPIEHAEWVPAAHVHRHLVTGEMAPEGDPVSGRRCLMWNADLEVSICRPESELEAFYRNGEGDEVIFVSEGEGTLETIFGTVPFREHDYVVIPRGTTYRLELDSTPQTWLVFHTPGEIETPNRYRNRYGQLLESAPYSQRDFRPPDELDTHREEGDFELIVRVRGGLQHYKLDYHPFDVVGWDGYVYPYTFNVHDFEPRTGRLHLPPPVHQTFQGPNFVICSFCPRELDYDPEAVPLPYHHSNLQSEEMIYYVSGEFGSRKGIEVGSITVHPSGLPHGPQPGLVEKALGMRRTEELAVMWDTFRPMRLTELARELDDPAYAYSWREGTPSPVAESTTG